jgi:hypothetical protein
MPTIKVQHAVDSSAQNADWWLATVGAILAQRRRRARRMLASQSDTSPPAPTEDEGGGKGGGVTDVPAPPPAVDAAGSAVSVAIRGLLDLGSMSYVTTT